MAVRASTTSGPLLYWRIMTVLTETYGHFTSATLVALVGDRHRKGIERYCAFLLEERVLTAEASRYGAAITHRYAIARPGDAPPLRMNGDLGGQQQALWRCIRRLPTFTSHELAVSASTDDRTVPTHTASAYLGALLKAGYVIREPFGRGPRHAPVYRLLPARNTGPRAPMVVRPASVFDLNLMRRVSAADKIGRAA